MDEKQLFSGDFTVLSQNGENMERDGVSSTSDIDPEQRAQLLQAKENERDAAIRKLCVECGGAGGDESEEGVRVGTRPLRIVVLGKHGAGKSSFINGVAAALSEERWREYAYTGNRGIGAPITIVNQRFEKCCNGHRDRFNSVYLPTLIDVAGLNDEADDKMEELLRLLFYGHIKEDEAVMSVYKDVRNSTLDHVRRQYSKVYPDMRVDRVVFVASAADPLPDRLMACVLRAARPEHHMDVRRSVPMYGVLTKMDKVDKVDTTSSSFLDTKRKFMQDLGLNQSRLLICKNYCDDLDPKGSRTKELDPELDLPYVYFMQQLCDSALKVIREDEVLPGGEATPEEQQNAENAGRQAAFPPWIQDGMRTWRGLDVFVRDFILSVVVTMGILLFVTAFGASAQSMCRDGSIDKSLCENNSPWVGFRVMVNHTILSLLGGVSFFVFRYFNRP